MIEDTLLEDIIVCAKAAGAMMLEAEDQDKDVQEKAGDSNFVTKYDSAIQAFLEKELKQILPGSGLLGEEDGKSVPDGADWEFIVDPIDGTTNFIHGYRHSCVSIALAYQGDTRYAVVYDPYTDTLYTAKKGCGAFRNGKVIHVSDRPLNQALICFGTSPYNAKMAENGFEIAQALFRKAADIRRSGSAVLDLCAVACGAIELHFELVNWPWDFAAGALLIEEAGGIVSRIDGKPRNVYEPSSIVAANPKVYHAFFAEGFDKLSRY